MSYYTVEIPHVYDLEFKVSRDGKKRPPLTKKMEELNEKHLEIKKHMDETFWAMLSISSPRRFITPKTTLASFYRTSSPAVRVSNINEKLLSYYLQVSEIIDKLPVHSGNSSLFPIYPEFNQSRIRVLNMVGLFQFNDMNALYEYRKRNFITKKSKNDEYVILDFKDMITKDNILIDSSYIEPFTKKPFSYHRYDGTICDLIDTINLEGGLFDIVISTISMYSYDERWKTEYRNMINKFAVISHLSKFLRKGGLFILGIRDNLLKLSNDLFFILANMFESVKIVKALQHPVVYPYKSVVCTGYKGNIELENKVKRIFNKWNSGIERCGLETNNIPEIVRVLKNRLPYINLILAEKDKQMMVNEYEYGVKIHYDLHNIPVYNEEAKVKALNIFHRMRSEIPPTLIYKRIELIKMFRHQSSIKNEIKTEEIGEEKYEYQEIEKMTELSQREYESADIQIEQLEDPSKYYRYLEMLDISREKMKTDLLLASGYPVSGDFLKMMEILVDTDLVENKKIRVLHLCEGPGQSILAFKRFCNQNDIEYEWNAQTYRPNDSKIMIDRYGLIRRNPEKWIWGDEGDGDIMNYKNLKIFAKKEKYDIITGICGQSESEEHIFLSQFTAMVLGLKEGGNCVLKGFLPFIRPIQISLMYLMYQCFEKIIYYKPSIGPTTGELYVVGKGFKGLSGEIKMGLLKEVKNYKEGIKKRWLFKTFDKGFIDKHMRDVRTCVLNRKLSVYRIIVITYFYNKEEHYRIMDELMDRDAEMWLEKYLQKLS